MSSRLLVDPRRVLAAAQDEARRRYTIAIDCLVVAWRAWRKAPTRTNALRYSAAFSFACETLLVLWMAGGLLVPDMDARGLAAGRLFIGGFPLPVKLLRRVHRRVGPVGYRLPPFLEYPGMWN